MKTVIVTSFDENYIEPSAVSLTSLSQNYFGSDKLDVVCLVPVEMLDYQDEYIKLLDVKNLNIEFRSSPKYLDLVNRGAAYSYQWISGHCNHRIFLGSILPDYDKAIYIDSDTLFVRNVEPLLRYPLRNKLLAMVEYSRMNSKTFNDTDRPYFNNGVFIADLNYWRESGAEDRMVEWQALRGPTQCPEQDAMNAVFIDVWSPLPASFNTFEFYLSTVPFFEMENDTPLLIHYLGPEKPWLPSGRPGKWQDLWRSAYLSKFPNYGKIWMRERI